MNGLSDEVVERREVSKSVLENKGALLMVCGSLEKRESSGRSLFQPSENPEGYQKWEPQMMFAK